ncbi:MAG TPA: hypothetical protein VFS40_04365 [Gemmatimonadales bacterium]|nr:hypothetical protein [Gemmatimonadales bacterium]
MAPRGLIIPGLRRPVRAVYHQRRAARLIAPLLLATLAALGSAGCGERAGRRGAADSAAAEGRGGPPPRFVAVQLAAFPDSAAAGRLRDSLARAGWVAYVRSADTAAAGRWAVRVAPTRNLAYAAVTAYALRGALGAGRRPHVANDSGTTESQGVVGFSRVNYGTHGMAVRTRWALSPDRRTLLAVEDPAGVENAPLPNGFFSGAEDGMRSLQVDSVWDAAPAPDWQRVGFGRAYLLHGGAAPEPPDSLWRALADTLGLTVAQLRKSAFRASGMATTWGVAQAGVAVLDSLSADQLHARVLYPVASGWRVRWGDDDGRYLLLGDAPAHPRDDAPAASWQRLDLASGQVAPAPAPAGRSHVPWVEGPVLDVSVAVDTARRTVSIEGAHLESRDGWIRLSGHVLGPGVLLAATRGGRFVLALVPNPEPAQGEAPWMFAVYTISPAPLL